MRVGELVLEHRRRALLALAFMLGVAIVAASPLRAAERNTYRVIPLVSDQPGWAFAQEEWSPAERERVRALAVGKYGRDGWNRKR